jgi:hypothetical protein
MSEPQNTREFWVGTIIDWLMKNAGLRRERIDLKRKFTQEPYNLNFVRVLNMMDDLVEVYKGLNKRDLTLTQNWRLAHRTDTVGDFIVAFLQIVTPEEAAAPAEHEAVATDQTSGQVSESGQRTKHNGRLEALRANPGGGWSATDLEIIASQFAIKFRKTTGTHEVFLHPSVPNCVTVPLRKKIQPPHIRALVAMIDRMDELDR